MFWTRRRLAERIEALLLDDRYRVQRTLPAEFRPTQSYLAMNNHPGGIPPARAEQASWHATEAHRFNVEPGFVLLGLAPPDRPGGSPMLLALHDPTDGTGTQLLGAWWLRPDAPDDAVSAFSGFLARFGARLTSGHGEGVFFLWAEGDVPPLPARGELDVELHALRQTRQFAGPVGWAWCFGIDVRSYRSHVAALGQ